MNMEQKYIEKVLEDMNDRLEYVKNIKNSFETRRKESEENSYGEGLYRGNIIACENQIEFLEREIKFLKCALEN